MKKLLFLLIFWAFPVMSATIEADTAVLQGMDKVTGRVKEITLPVGASIDFGELTITVDKCMTKTPEETPENAAYMRIFQKENKLFDGWMFSSNPAISAMEDPVYDVWVVSCALQDHTLTEPDLSSNENTEVINESEIED